MKLNILRADPAGNITVFVLDPVEKAKRAAIAEKIMAIPSLKAEQVGYACPAEDDVDGHMEMMGGEFCGNATRAYGMYIAQQKGGPSAVRLRVSGCDHVVTAQGDLKSGTARAEMPCPRSVRRAAAWARGGGGRARGNAGRPWRHRALRGRGRCAERGIFPRGGGHLRRYSRTGRLRRHLS